MSIFKYRVSYEFLGPSKEDPFATKPLSPDQVRHYLEGLSSILPPHFSATLKDNSLSVTAITSDSEQDTDTALERRVANLNIATPGLSLVIEKLSGQ